MLPGTNHLLIVIGGSPGPTRMFIQHLTSNDYILCTVHKKDDCPSHPMLPFQLPAPVDCPYRLIRIAVPRSHPVTQPTILHTQAPRGQYIRNADTSANSTVNDKRRKQHHHSLLVLRPSSCRGRSMRGFQ